MREGHPEMIEHFVQLCPDFINYQMRDTGNTMLFMACQAGWPDIVEFLLSHKANPNIPYGSRYPLDIAEEYGHKEIVEILKKIGATSRKEQRRMAQEAERVEMERKQRERELENEGFYSFDFDRVTDLNGKPIEGVWINVLFLFSYKKLLGGEEYGMDPQSFCSESHGKFDISSYLATEKKGVLKATILETIDIKGVTIDVRSLEGISEFYELFPHSHSIRRVWYYDRQSSKKEYVDIDKLREDDNWTAKHVGDILGLSH